MKKVTLITAILILTASFSSFANVNSVKPTETTSIVTSENNTTVIELPFTQLNDFKIDFNVENEISYIEKYQSRKSTSTKSKLNNVQNLLKNPERKERVLKVLC